jgi:hypothetical protein
MTVTEAVRLHFYGFPRPQALDRREPPRGRRFYWRGEPEWPPCTYVEAVEEVLKMYPYLEGW